MTQAQLAQGTSPLLAVRDVSVVFGGIIALNQPLGLALAQAIDDQYRRGDSVVGKALEFAHDQTLVMVLRDRGFTAELRAFTDAIRAGEPSPVPATEALESLRVGLAALESVRTGETIDLTSWETA